MRDLLRPLLVVGLALLVPIVPFLGFGPWLEGRIEAWLDPPPPPAAVALGTVALLSTDVLLPIPSSVVSTVAGAQLGIALATLASWLGMTLGAVVGFSLAKSFGRGVAAWLSSADDLDGLDTMACRYGTWVLIVTRALPILAEAAVLLMGAARLPWRRFLPAIMLSNLGIALVYAILGHLARDRGQLIWAIAVSIALPLLATTMARWLLARTSTPTQPQ
ncbi:MAG: VTT domain-containing protein [Pirellulales bacterium]